MFNQYAYLYIEDDPLSREVLSMMMTTAMQVEQLDMFESSEAFLERIQSLGRQPDIILMDIHMQPFDGFEMLTMLRSLPDFRDVKVIALTASVMSEEIEALRASGFDGAIGKPLSVQTFPGLIKRILQDESVWHIA